MVTLPTNYRDITWRQMWNFRSISEQHLVGEIDSYAFRKQVYDWHSTVIKIQESVYTQFNFFAWGKDFISLRIIKKWVVRILVYRELQHIDKTINEISYFLFHNKKEQDPLKTIAKAHQYFKDHREKLLAPIVAQQQALGVVRPQGTPTEVEARVYQFFQEKIVRAKADHKALPSWYHAAKSTPDTLLEILSSQKLRQNHASAGKGSYVSSNYEVTYGSYGLALDAQAVKHLPAQYFLSHQALSPEQDPWWVQVKGDIPLHWKTISHIVVPTEDQKASFLQRLQEKKELQEGDAAQLKSLPIVDLDTNRIVSTCFAYTTPRFLPPPPFWTQHLWNQSKHITPSEIRPREYRALFFLEHSA